MMIIILWVIPSVQTIKKDLVLSARAMEYNWKGTGDVEASFCGSGFMKN